MPTHEKSADIPFTRRGDFKENILRIHDTTISTLRTFTEPTDSLGKAIDINIATGGNRSAHLKAIFGKKYTRETLSSGDSLVVHSFMSPHGLLVVTDIEDGFTAIDTDSWKAVAAATNHTAYPRDADVFFTMINHAFANSDALKHWATQTVSILDQFPSTIQPVVSLPNHPSPWLEIALKQIQRDYLETKNTFRVQTLGSAFFDSKPGKEIANGIFGISSMFIPREALSLPESEGVQTSGSTIGGFAVCRSLADIAVSTTFPFLSIFLTDANAFFDVYVQKMKQLVTPAQFTEIRKQIYEKIDRIYAAYNASGVIFPLTEEESFSGRLSPQTILEISGATDGAYFQTRDHDGDPKERFAETLTHVMEDPLSVLSQLKAPADDYLLYNISIT